MAPLKCSSVRQDRSGWCNREPERVAVAGEWPGVVGDACDDLEDCGVAVMSLAHASCGLGDGPDKCPGKPPEFAAAGALAALRGDCEHAILHCSNLTDAQPVQACAAQVGCQVELRVFGDPARPAGQRSQFVNGR